MSADGAFAGGVPQGYARSVRRVPILIVLVARIAYGEPGREHFLAGAGVEGGAWIQVVWFGGVVELELPITKTFAIRTTARWQWFSDVHDECSFNFVGQQLDGTTGIRWRPPWIDWSDVHPFLAAQGGGGFEHVHSTCPGARSFNRGAWMFQASGGIDIDAPGGSTIRLQVRTSIADFVSNGAGDQVFNQQVGLAALLVASW